jgi:murein L,D-transpeptidase YafK
VKGVRYLSRAACAALCAASALAAADPNPETQLLGALDHLDAGRVNEAWSLLDQLVQRQPNFRLARLFHGELRAAREGAPSRDLAASADPEVHGLVEEARLRLQQWRSGVPDGATPDAVLQLARGHDHAVVVDLPAARLYLIENRGGTLHVVQHFYASIGKGGWGKATVGDNRTPVGVYRVTGFIPDRTLPELYGAGAFPVNYPNAWDRRRRATGSGIWLHGVPRDTYARAPRSSEGCVTLANADLLELKPYLVPGETPVVFAEKLNWLDRDAIWDARADFLQHVEDWRARWSALDTDGYLAYYADDFETDGMGKAAFAAHKRRVNAGKASVDVQLSDVDLFRYPGPEELMLATFTQHYRSDNFNLSTRKEQYWRRDSENRWRIVKETNR